MFCLLQSMANTWSSSNTDQQQQLLLRNGMLFSLLWQSCFRGFNAGAMRLENIVLPTGDGAVPHLVPQVKLCCRAMCRAILHLLPDTTTNKKGGHCRIVLSCDILCLSSWLQRAMHHCAAAGQQSTNFITRPLAVGTKRFAGNRTTATNNTWPGLHRA